MQIQSLILVIFLVLQITEIRMQACNEMTGGCTFLNCVNGTCKACDNGNNISSKCLCQQQEYFNYQNGCLQCSIQCQNCYGPTKSQCLSCPKQEGLVLNKITNECICSKGYIMNEKEFKCEPCFQYGQECNTQCPENTIPNEKYMICEKEPNKNIKNDDDLMYICTTIALVVVIIIITIYLFGFFGQIYKKILKQADKQGFPLCQEEKNYLKQLKILQEQQRQQMLTDIENQRQKKIEQEEQKERIRQLILQEQKKQLEIEKELKELEEKERKKQEEEEEIRKMAEIQAIKLLEEENQRRIREEERKRQKEKEEEEQRDLERLEKERLLEIERIKNQQRIREEEEQRELQRLENLRLEEEENQKRIIEQERLKQIQREVEERKKREEEELLRVQQENEKKLKLKEMARLAREKRLMEKQLTKQKTMALNQEKQQKLREKREKLQKEKKQAEEEKNKIQENETAIQKEFKKIQEKINDAKQQQENAQQIKQSINEKQEYINSIQKEIDQELDGLDLQSAINAVQNINQEDIIFLQNLKKPPARIVLCLEATCIILSKNIKPQPWDDIRKMIANQNFRKNLLNFNPDTIDDKIYNKITNFYLKNPQWVLKKMFQASKAAGAFSIWIQAIISYKQIKMDNKELFDKMKQMQQQKLLMNQELQKVEEINEQVIKLQEEQQNLLNMEIQLKQKQQMFFKQQTIKEEIIQKKQEEIEDCKSENLELEEIEESEEEDSESDDSEINDIINNLQTSVKFKKNKVHETQEDNIDVIL